MSKSPHRMTFEELDDEYQRNFRSRHYQRSGGEAYDFDIKIQKIHIPNIVRKVYSEQKISDRVEFEMQNALNNFGEHLKDTYDWVEGWHQEGRSGGWLVVATDQPAFILSFEEGASRNFVKQRIRDLRKIEKDVEEGKKELVKAFEDPDYWEIGPRDWSPRWKKE